MASFINLTIGAAVLVSMLVLSSKVGRARFMNGLRRFAGLWFVSLGSLAFLATLASTIWPNAFPDDRHRPISGDVTLLVISSLVVAFGIWLIRTPSYRPDLGDT